MYCGLCPRNCAVDRQAGDTGFCGMDNRIKIARAALHFWEEPCISGTNGSGTVFFSGCNLRCVFCQNYKISTCRAGKYVSEAELADIFLDLQSQYAHNINLVTPTHFVPQIVNALKTAKKNGLNIPIVYNCGGYESINSLKMLDGLIDIYMPDFKYFNNKYANKYSSAPDYSEVVRAAVAEMFRQCPSLKYDKRGIMQKGVIVRHLVLPHLLFDSKKILDYLLHTYNNKILISIMNQYTPLKHVKKYPELNTTISDKYYKTLTEYAAEAGITNAFIQEGGTVGESFIPEFFEE